MPNPDQTQPPTGPELIEEVATVIHAGLLGDDPLTVIAKDAVLATLDAIRNPSEAMIDALRKEIARGH